MDKKRYMAATLGLVVATSPYIAQIICREDHQPHTLEDSYTSFMERSGVAIQVSSTIAVISARPASA